jgi:hypothetical protein
MTLLFNSAKLIAKSKMPQENSEFKRLTGAATPTHQTRSSPEFFFLFPSKDGLAILPPLTNRAAPGAGPLTARAGGAGESQEI